MRAALPVDASRTGRIGVRAAAANASHPCGARATLAERPGSGTFRVAVARDPVERPGAIAQNAGSALASSASLADDPRARRRDLTLRLIGATAIGVSEDEFDNRFDGTPGSLTLDLQDMRRRYIELQETDEGGVAMNRLLDAAKSLHAGGQPRFALRVLREVAERIAATAG